MSILRRLAVALRSYVRSTSERIAAEEEPRDDVSRRPPDAVQQQPSPTIRAVPPQLEADYRYLGLAPGADLSSVEVAWRALASRADPKRFPPGSAEEKRAAELLKSLNEAYYRLREALNPTEGRFGQLEL